MLQRPAHAGISHGAAADVKATLERPGLMQWTAPTRRHLGAKMSLMLRSGLSPLMAEGVEELGAERFFATIVPVG